MTAQAQESAKKELLLLLGRKLHEGLADEKIALVPDAVAKDFRSELERVTTLIDYVENKQRELQAKVKGAGRSSRNIGLRSNKL